MEVNVLSRQSLPVSRMVWAGYSGSRISLPVEGGAASFARLKHVTAVSAGSQQPGYSITRLRNIDQLIERLKMLKGQDFSVGGFEKEDPRALEQLEQILREELYRTAKSRLAPYNAGLGMTAVTLDITA